MDIDPSDAQRTRVIRAFLTAMGHVEQEIGQPPVVCTGGAVLHMLYGKGLPGDIDIVSSEPNGLYARRILADAARIAAVANPQWGIHLNARGQFLEFSGTDGYPDRVEIDVHTPDQRMPTSSMVLTDGSRVLINRPEWIVAKKIELVVKRIGDVPKHFTNVESYLGLDIPETAVAAATRALLLTGTDAIGSAEELNALLVSAREDVKSPAFDRVVLRLSEIGIVPEQTVASMRATPTR